MKTGDFFVESSLSQNLANAKGRFSTQFMSGDLRNEYPSRKKAIEESVVMGGYEVNFRKSVNKCTDMQQPTACHSEFWIG